MDYKELTIEQNRRRRITMKTPDKIYIHETIHLGLLSASEIDITGQDEQYIRKDALLEWIDEYKNFSSGPSWDLLKTKIESL